MAIINPESTGNRPKAATRTNLDKKNHFDCFDLLKMAGQQQDADKKMQDVLIVSNLLANFQRLIEEKCIQAGLHTSLK